MNGKVICPNDCLPCIKNFGNKRQEHFGVICLDSEQKIICRKVLFIGTEHKATIDTKMIFWYALSKKASSIIVFHNHPGNNETPSDDDFETTRALYKACRYVGLPLLDHIIVTKYVYYSFDEYGYDEEYFEEEQREVAEE